MGKLVLNSIGSGSVSLDAPNTAENTIISVPAANAGMQVMRLETAQNTTSGTSVEFTNIPSWVKKITLLVNGISTTSNVVPKIQLIASSVPVTTGYVGDGWYHNTIAISASATISSGFELLSSWSSAGLYSGTFTLTNISNNTWIHSGTIGAHTFGAGGGSTGVISLGSALDGIRLTMDGTATFDAGSVNLLLEGY